MIFTGFNKVALVDLGHDILELAIAEHANVYVLDGKYLKIHETYYL